MVGNTAWTYLVDDEFRNVQVHPKLLVNDGNALLQAVHDGIGIGYLFRYAVDKEFKTGRLVQVLPDVKFPDYTPIYALYPALGFLPQKTKAFLKTLEQMPFTQTHYCRAYSRHIRTSSFQ
jgi:DNA-binding transcriptional LysR family regulator